MQRIILLFIFLLCSQPLTAQVGIKPKKGAEEPMLAKEKERLERIEQRLQMLAEDQLPGLNEEVNFSVVSAPIQEFLRGVAEIHKLNISIDPGLKLKVTNNFTNARVADLLLFLCREYGLDIRFTSSIMSFYKPQELIPPAQEKILNISYESADSAQLLTMDLRRDSLEAFVRQLTELTGNNVLLAPGTKQQLISGYITAKPFREALDKIAFANQLELEVTEDGFYILGSTEEEEKPVQEATSNRRRRNQRTSSRRSPSRPPSQASEGLEVYFSEANDSLMTVEALNVPVAEAIKQISLEAGKDFVFFSEPKGAITAQLEAVGYEELLAFLLNNTDHTYKKQEGIYLIGNRQQEGLRATKLVRLQFRSVKDIQKTIPAEMSKGVQIQEFGELNALILSGGSPQIYEIESFLKAIDQPVPNIQIEVIVAEVRKGYGIETGIKAGIADSVPSTGGSLFPSVDFTLSSKGMNKLLGMLSGQGIVNLGKVQSNFYMTLKALEQNNNLTLRSTPKLATLNGHEATLVIGKSVYYLEETQNINGGVNPITTVSKQYKNVEANMSITINPSVSGDEHITLDIDTEFSDFISPEVQGAPPGNATRKFTSQVRVKNEEMIVLGGLEEVKKQNTSTGLPLLARIPVIKWLFSSRSKQKSESSLVIFIRPVVVY